MERKPTRPSRSRGVSHHEYQRAYQACIPCAKRKTKCKRSDNATSCERCEKKGIRCMSSNKRPWSREPERVNSGNEFSPSVLETVVSNEQDAMRLLFKAAAPSQPAIEVDAPQLSRTEDKENNQSDALRVWNGCRFVRMGWFTAQEAISLVEWYGAFY
ncbi:hypothetical protein AbraIFM66950_001887 [Aspergillus brasiliensis]|nr:hypothetical protein AbraIFM66950_001887 [Aspergillus brasiliensis]